MRQLRGAPRDGLGILGCPHRRRSRARNRVQAHGHLQDGAERPVGAREKLGQVVARHVLDHLAAAAGERAVGKGHRHAEHQVAWRAVAVAERP